MNENVKTMTFVGVAAVVVLVAWLSGPRAAYDAQQSLVGEELVAAFDPLDAASLEIVEFDESTAAVKPFSVERKQIKDRVTWVIPSHEDYPTDAQNQLAEAATALMGLKVLEMPSDSPGTHATFGLLDPTAKRSAGDRGVGKRVTIRNQAGKELLSLIIGKTVDGNSELQYMRRANDDRVAVVKARTDKLTTDFEKWIEKDLLKLNPWDIKQVRINDYAADLLRRLLDMRRRMVLDYNDTGDPKWTLASDRMFDKTTGEWVDVELGEGEQLDTGKLDAMKGALDDLKIVDVNRKPGGLSADLKKTGDVIENEESLVGRGFVLADAGTGEGRQLYSNQGEIRVTMKDGVEYVLRFGEVTGEESKTAAPAEGEAPKPTGMNRHLFVMVEFNEQAIERPKLEEEPKDDAPADEKADEKKANDEAKPADEAKAGEEKADEAKPDEAKPDEAKEEPAADEKAKAREAELERIRTENKRRLDEYEELKAKGQARVKELNDRFADWYYVISNSEFEKIHLGRDEIVKPKEDKKDEPMDGDHAGHDHADHDHDHESDAMNAFDAMKETGPAGN
jgi:hypothetical protein